MLAKTSSRSAAAFARRSQLITTGSAAYTSVVVEKALNSKLWDLDGKEYIDFAGGIGTLNVGHCHPAVVEAIRQQAGKLLHTSLHVAAYEPYFEAAERLIQAAPGDFKKKAVFFNSGSEAVENAVKFARAFTKRRGVISFENAFHGRTLLCLTLDGKHKPLRQGFGPVPAEIYHSAFPYPYRPPRGVKPEDLTAYCLEELDKLFAREAAPEDVAAIIVEPVQGEGGFIVPPPDFLPALRRVCDKHGILLISDEVQTGFGRTGEMFAIEHSSSNDYKVVPDLMTVGKSLGAGLPLSAVVGRAEVLDAAAPGAIGGTYGGNPLACAAALAVFSVFKVEKLVDRARKIGRVVQERFDALQTLHPFIGESRGLGAMRALELVSDKRTKAPLPAAEVKKILHLCEDRGLMVIKAGAHDNVIRTLMPLTIPDEDLAKGLSILEGVLKEFTP